MITGCPMTHLSQTDKKSTSYFFRKSNLHFCPFIKVRQNWTFSIWLSLKGCVWYQSKHVYSGQEWSARASQSEWEHTRATQRMRMIYLWIWCLGKRGSLIDHISKIRLLWECVSWFQCQMIIGCPMTCLVQPDKKSTSYFFRKSILHFCPFIKVGPNWKFS